MSVVLGQCRKVAVPPCALEPLDLWWGCADVPLVVAMAVQMAVVVRDELWMVGRDTGVLRDELWMVVRQLSGHEALIAVNGGMAMSMAGAIVPWRVGLLLWRALWLEVCVQCLGCSFSSRAALFLVMRVGPWMMARAAAVTATAIASDCAVVCNSWL